MNFYRRDWLVLGLGIICGFVIGLLMNPGAAKPIGESIGGIITAAAAVLLFVLWLFIIAGMEDKKD